MSIAKDILDKIQEADVYHICRELDNGHLQYCTGLKNQFGDKQHAYDFKTPAGVKDWIENLAEKESQKAILQAYKNGQPIGPKVRGHVGYKSGSY